jgi:hypothetical protein
MSARSASCFPPPHRRRRVVDRAVTALASAPGWSEETLQCQPTLGARPSCLGPRASSVRATCLERQTIRTPDAQAVEPPVPSPEGERPSEDDPSSEDDGRSQRHGHRPICLTTGRACFPRRPSSRRPKPTVQRPTPIHPLRHPSSSRRDLPRMGPSRRPRTQPRPSFDRSRFPTGCLPPPHDSEPELLLVPLSPLSRRTLRAGIVKRLYNLCPESS